MSGWSSSQPTRASTPESRFQNSTSQIYLTNYGKDSSRFGDTIFPMYFTNSGLCHVKLYLGHQKHCLWFQRATSRQTRCSSVGSPSPSAGGRWVREGWGRSSVSSVWEAWHVVRWQVLWPRSSCSPRTAERTGGLILQPGTDKLPELQPACTTIQVRLWPKLKHQLQLTQRYCWHGFWPLMQRFYAQG